MTAPLAHLSPDQLEALVLALEPLAESEALSWPRYWARKIRDAAVKRIVDGEAA